jgi:hypothetical protein
MSAIVVEDLPDVSNSQVDLVAAGVAFVPVGYVFYSAAFSSHDWVYQRAGSWTDGGLHAAPGPIVGAGLPVLVVAGGVYWVVRRHRREAEWMRDVRRHLSVSITKSPADPTCETPLQDLRLAMVTTYSQTAHPAGTAMEPMSPSSRVLPRTLNRK